MTPVRAITMLSAAALGLSLMALPAFALGEAGDCNRLG